MPNCFLPVQNIVETPTDPANIRLDEEVLKTSSRRLDQDKYIRLSHTSSRRLGQDQYIRLCQTPARRLQDVFKTFSRCLAKTSSRRFEDVFKASSIRL